MKILNVCSTFDPVTGGGEAERTFQMSRFLDEQGEDCRILTIDTGLSDVRKNFMGIGKVIALPSLLKRFHVPRFSMKFVRRLVGEADIIHLIGHWSVLNAVVYLAAKKMNKPYAVCPAGALSIFGRSKFLKLAYNLVIGRRIIRDASVCIAVTEQEIDVFLACGAQRNRIKVIPNGIAQPELTIADEAFFARKFHMDRRPFLLFMGRLSLIKGPDLLLKAFGRVKEKLPEIDLVMAGPDDGMLDELQAIVKDQNLEGRVHFSGYVGGEEKVLAYREAICLIVPSRKEAMSIVVLEAGINGTPALMTDQCGFDQIAEVGGGWVVPATIEGLEDGLLQIFSEPEQIETASRNIQKYVVDQYSWHVIIQEYLTQYARLVKSSVN